MWLILLGPVLMALLMGRATQESDVKRPGVAVFAPPESGLARVLSASELLQVRTVSSAEEGERLLQSRQVAVYLSIPSGFDEQLLNGEVPRLDLSVDATRPTQVALAREALRSALRDQAGQELPADVRVVKATRALLGSQISLWIVFGLMSALTISASSMVEEKEAGTLQQILTTPVPFILVILGKVLVGATLAVLSAGLVLALNSPSHEFSWISVGLLIVTGAVVFSSMGTLLGLFVDGVTAASAWSGLLFVLLFLPCTLGEISQTMSRLAVWSPAYHLHDGLQRALLVGATPGQLGLPLAVLGGTWLGTALLGAASLRIRASS